MAGSAGLNISSFIKHSQDGGGRGQWLREWRKKGVGEVTVWVHTRAPIVACFSHQFMIEDTYQDKESGKTMPTLRFPRFASPDPEMVHRSQYFREDDGSLKVPPDRDPFLLLREWLRTAEADHIGLEDPVFRWEYPKERKIIVWERGLISGLVKRGGANYNQTLDTRLDYIYVVVDDTDVGAGPVLMREGKLLSQKISDVIRQQQKQWGDNEGDPTQHPYAFLLVAQDASSPMNAFSAYKAERAEFTDAVWEQISSDEYPDPKPYSEPNDGDMDKIKDAMQAAAQVELPLDRIFSDDQQVRRDLIGKGPKMHSMMGAPRQSKAAQARAVVSQAQRPPVPSNTNAAVSAAAVGGGRRKKVAPAAPPPEAETIACDDCGHLMLVTATKCEKCGSEYEVESDPDEAAAVSSPVPAKPAAVAKAKPTMPATPSAKQAAPTPTGAKPVGGGAKPRTRTKQDSAQTELPTGEVEEPGGESQKCWACSSLVTAADVNADGTRVCPDCGVEQGDDIPF